VGGGGGGGPSGVEQRQRHVVWYILELAPGFASRCAVFQTVTPPPPQQGSYWALLPTSSFFLKLSPIFRSLMVNWLSLQGLSSKAESSARARLAKS